MNYLTEMSWDELERYIVLLQEDRRKCNTATPWGCAEYEKLTAEIQATKAERTRRANPSLGPAKDFLAPNRDQESLAAIECKRYTHNT